MDSVATPTNFFRGPKCRMSSEKNLAVRKTVACDGYEVSAMNAGSEPTDGEPVTLTDTLPPGVTVQELELFCSRKRQHARTTTGSIGGATHGSPQHTVRMTVPVVSCMHLPGRRGAPDDWLQMGCS